MLGGIIASLVRFLTDVAHQSMWYCCSSGLEVEKTSGEEGAGGCVGFNQPMFAGSIEDNEPSLAM